MANLPVFMGDAGGNFDYHLHTNWTDGQNTSLEMYRNAIEIGLSSILFSEHARESSTDWFHDFAREIRSLPESTCEALVGVEAKIIDFAGSIDSVDEILEECDLVMAVVHRFPGEVFFDKHNVTFNKSDAIKIEIDLSLSVLENEKIDILGHPLGMSIRRFNLCPTDDDFKTIISRAAEMNVAVEINSHYHDNPWDMIGWCEEAGATISLGSNAHQVDELGRINRLIESRGLYGSY